MIAELADNIAVAIQPLIVDRFLFIVPYINTEDISGAKSSIYR